MSVWFILVGSVMDSFLFVLRMNDVIKIELNKEYVINYVDDTSLMVSALIYTDLLEKADVLVTRTDYFLTQTNAT